MEGYFKYNYVVTFVLVGLITFFSLFFYTTYFSVDSREFAGTLKGVGIDSISVSGSFSSIENPEVAKIPRNVTIQADSRTKIIKGVVYLPTVEELKKTGGTFNGKDLKREEVTGNFESLKADFYNKKSPINIFVKTSRNVYGKKTFTASEIKYEIAL